MANQLEAAMLSRDMYPSRKGAEAAFLKRLDPVVYASDYNQAPIASNVIDEFKESGFVTLENLFDDIELQMLLEESARLREDASLINSIETITEPDTNDVRSIFRVHEQSPIFSKLAADNRLAGLAKFLLDDEVYIHQSRLNYKPGFRGKEFYWHSDFETWHVEDGMPRMRALSMSITLTENYSYNGPLMLIPKSHFQYVVCEGETPENHFRSSLKKQEYGVPKDHLLKQLINEGGIVTVTGKPGSVTLFDSNIMHGSNGNITPFPRSNIFFVYNALSNRVIRPFCNRPPRPEYICTRNNTQPLRII